MTVRKRVNQISKRACNNLLFPIRKQKVISCWKQKVNSCSKWDLTKDSTTMIGDASTVQGK